MNLLVVPELLPQDVLAAGLLQNKPILFRVHPPVHHPDAAGKLPAEEIVLDRLHGCHVRRVSWKSPALDGNAFFSYRQADDNLRKIRSVILGVPYRLRPSSSSSSRSK